jgi:hypothetical protein
MKKTIKLFSAIIIAGIVGLTSCSKDATTTLLGEETTVTISDSLGKNEVGNKNSTVYFRVVAKLASGATAKSTKIERKIGSGATETILNNDRLDTVAGTSSNANDVLDDNLTGKTLVVGENVVYTVTLTDSKAKTVTSSTSFKIVRVNGILASSEIELGAQANATIGIKFLGLDDNFMTYTSGASGTAKVNSAKIDFVYYYGTTQENAFAAPSNTDGAQVIWDKEITTWDVKNITKFKTTTITATDFDAIKSTSKVDDTFYNIDFTSGTTDKVVKFTAGTVVAFKTAAGVVGLAKFTAAATANDGSMKVQIICQN